jgi:amidase
VTAITIERTNGIIRELSISRNIANGALSALRFFAKDLYDVSGFKTGAGNPDWLRTHEVASQNAQVVDYLLDAGATLIGKTTTDEIAYSVDGINAFYGAPVNPQYPSRTCGGSSSGSASTVAAGLADFALGTDTAGSVRIPASFCGIYGFRPTHNRISLAGVVPLAPIFDTVGWMARDPHIMRRCGEVLLKESPVGAKIKKLLVAVDAMQYVDPDIGAALAEVLSRIKNHFPVVEAVSMEQLGWDGYVDCFRIVQSFDAWNVHKEWITRERPTFSPAIQERFDFASKVTSEQNKSALEERARLVKQYLHLLPPGTVLCMPTTWDLPPRVDAEADELMHQRLSNLKLTTLSPLANLPQITIPVKFRADASTGLSFIGGQHDDMLLLQLAEQLAPRLEKFESERFPGSSR